MLTACSRKARAVQEGLWTHLHYDGRSRGHKNRTFSDAEKLMQNFLRSAEAKGSSCTGALHHPDMWYPLAQLHFVTRGNDCTSWAQTRAQQRCLCSEEQL